MSHFTVLVVGADPEDQLAPFDENLRTEFEDKTEEYKKEYLNEMVKQFYCDSSASWGMQITRELYNKLRTSKAGRIIIHEITKRDIGSYYKRGGKYKGYFRQDDGGRCKGSQWFEVDSVLETTHPDEDVCFEGKIKIRKISPPKEIALSDRYPLYEDYLRDWHGIENADRQGYDFNPKAKWDWHQLGGRWSGFFKIRSTAQGVQGTKSWTNEEMDIGANWVDQARKGDIDFTTMEQKNLDEATDIYNEFKEGFDKGEMTPADGYFRFGVENKGDKDNYVPETREEYLKRCVAFSTFAVLKDGEWYEKGEMGWWGCVSDEKDPEEWSEQFNKLVTELPEDTLLSVYDCHI